MANYMHTDARHPRWRVRRYTSVDRPAGEQAAPPGAAGRVDVPESFLRHRQAPLNPGTQSDLRSDR